MLLVLVFLINFNIIELLQDNSKEPFQDTVDLRGQLVSQYNLNNRDYDTIGDIAITDRIIEDGSFLRLNNLTIGYDLPTNNTDIFFIIILFFVL